MSDTGRDGAALPPEQRLHLNMRPPSPATYRAPVISRGSWFFIVVGGVSALLLILFILSFVACALMAGEPG